MLQRTIKKEISISGIGLHTGKNVSIKLRPAVVNSGIRFIRIDLPGAPAIKANLSSVSSTLRGTNLSYGGVEISTVEHLLSALCALSITNLDVEIDSNELPALDGSSKPYCEMILKAGMVAQGTKAKSIEITEPIIEIDGGKIIIALPSDRFKISFMINYPVDFIGTQFCEFVHSEKGYIKEIAPARTYGFMDEVETLKKQGLAAGASADNAVAIGKDGYLTKLRFKDELVRHKILDLIGDLSLLEAEIKGRIICVRSGHGLNIKLAKKLEEVGKHY